MDQNEPNLDKDPKLDGEPKLTREIVRIDYGKYVVAHDINSNSLAYKFVMKVYNLEDESAIQHWFYCPFCKILMEQNVTIGTTPLVRHVEKSCPNVPEHTRQELNVLREQKAKRSTKAKKNTMHRNHHHTQKHQLKIHRHLTNKLYCLLNQRTNKHQMKTHRQLWSNLCWLLYHRTQTYQLKIHRYLTNTTKLYRFLRHHKNKQQLFLSHLRLVKWLMR